MSTAESWRLTPREFEARVKIRESYLAMWKAETRNAPHFRREDKLPWQETHFLDDPRKSPAEEARDRIALMKARMEMALVKQNPDIVPEWARAPYVGPSLRKPTKRVTNG